jgi:hypothetical protein
MIKSSRIHKFKSLPGTPINALVYVLPEIIAISPAANDTDCAQDLRDRYCNNMKRYFKIMLLCAFLVSTSAFAMAKVAISGTHIFGPVSDAYLQGSVRNNNDLLKLNRKNNRVSYLRFHINDIGDQKIKRAKLRLRVHRDGGGGPMSIFRGNSSIWTETNLNKSNAPKAVGAAIARKNETYRVDQWYVFDVTSAITDGPVSFILSKDSTANDVAFGSKEAAGYEPELIIETNTATKSQGIILTLVNSKTNRDLFELNASNTINLQKVGRSLNIRADVNNKITSIRFLLNGKKINNDSNAPYYFAGDDKSWTPSRGAHTTEVIAFKNNKRVAQRTIKFTVTDKNNLGSTYYKKSRGDLISLHYDHMPDPDDGHATVAARTVTRHFGIKPHVVAGTHSFPVNRKNAFPKPFQKHALKVMSATWGNAWLNAHNYNNNYAPNAQAVKRTAKKWRHTLQNGGHVWVAEGGPSDFTAHVLKYMKNRLNYQFKKPRRIHVIQHGAEPCSKPNHYRLNERNTGKDNLRYVQNHTDYEIIGNGNCSQKNDVFLPTANFRSKNKAFNQRFKNAAAKHVYAAAWSRTFKYWDPVKTGNNEALAIRDGVTMKYPWAALDFSDTVELMRILGIGIDKVSDCKDFLNVFLK